MIKLTFEHQSVADSVKEKGFSVGGWAIPGHAIRYEEHYPILQCMKCFEFETHATNKCKIKYQICSECACRNHTFRNCPNPNAAKCVNCLKKGSEFNHRTLANACPEKRKIILRKRKEEQEKSQIQTHLPMAKAVSQMIVQQSTIPVKQTNRWADHVSKKQQQQTTETPQATPGTPEKKNKKKTNDLIKSILVCTINAHFHNKCFPGTYNKKLNYLLQKNSIPYTDVGEDWDSAAILNSLEDDLLENMGEESVIRDSPAAAQPASDVTSPVQAEIQASTPRGSPWAASLESLDSSVGEEEKRDEAAPRRKRKKKKRKKMENELPQQNWALNWPITADTVEEAHFSEEENSKNMLGRNLGTVKLEYEEDQEIEEVLALRIFYKEDPPSDQERMHLFAYFKSMDEDHQKREKMSKAEKAGLAYWSCTQKKRTEEQNRGITNDLKQRAKTWREIQQSEEEHRRYSYHHYGKKEDITEETEKFHDLISRKHLFQEEREELKEMYMHCSQCNITAMPNLIIAKLIALYRTYGIALTKLEYMKYKGMKAATDVDDLSWTEDSDSYIGEHCLTPIHSFSFE